MEQECIVYLFSDSNYDLDQVSVYNLESCQLLEEPMTIKLYEKEYNSPDYSDWGTDDYIRIFTFGKKIQAYLIYDEVSYPMVYLDDQPCSFGGNAIHFDDYSRDCIYLEDIPTQILDNLCEQTMSVKKVSVHEYEKLHNEQEWPLYVTFRITD